MKPSYIDQPMDGELITGISHHLEPWNLTTEVVIRHHYRPHCIRDNLSIYMQEAQPCLTSMTVPFSST